MPGQTVKLEWQGVPPDFYCPACGAAVIDQGGHSEKCPHVQFIYNGSTRTFDYLSDRIKDTAAQLQPRSDRKDNDSVIALMDRLDSSSMMCLHLCTYGFACCCIPYSVYVGIEFKPGPLS